MRLVAGNPKLPSPCERLGPQKIPFHHAQQSSIRKNFHKK